MKLSPRHNPVTLADIEIRQSVTLAVERHELTFAELVSILTGVVAGWTKMQIRDEREEAKR